MSKVTAINKKAIETKENVFCELTFDQINEINLKIHITLSTLDVFKTIDATSLNEHSLSTLAQEAYYRLEEARDILNPERG